MSDPNRCIYTLTSLICFEEQDDETSGCRCWGYFFTLGEAETAVAHNSGDMREGYYSHLVIERYDPGIHRLPEEVAWYWWHEGGWSRLPEKPRYLVRRVCFAIG